MTTFASKVKKFLKRGKAAQLNKFHDEVTEIYQDEIDRLEKENKKLKEKIERQHEAKADAVFNIDTDRINDVDSREKYVREHAEQLLRYDQDNIEPLEDELVKNVDVINELKELIKFRDEAEPNVEDQEDE